MANSQLKCLEEDQAYPLLTEWCPDFYYSEGQRLALDALLSSGASAFHDRLRAENLRHFLSPEEVARLEEAAEDYQVGEVDLEGEAELGEDLSLSYWPSKTDTPTPVLELGWPEQGAWKGITRAELYTHPPSDNAPHIKEVVRRSIQNATKVIAVVMDIFTDPDLFMDLHEAASRKMIPVYLLLSQQHLPAFLTMVETTGINLRLAENMRVRVISGCSFHTRHLKQVTGTLKEKFVLVDGESVITGTYSFTWSDAHLDRNLVTVLTGEITDSFDKEFRTLFASSRPLQLLKMPGFEGRKWRPPSPASPTAIELAPRDPLSPPPPALALPEPYSNGFTPVPKFVLQPPAAVDPPTSPHVVPLAGAELPRRAHKIVARRTVAPTEATSLGKEGGGEVLGVPAVLQDSTLTPREEVNLPDHSIRHRLSACRTFEGPADRLRGGQDAQSALSDILKNVQRSRLSVAKTAGARPSKSLWDLSRLSQLSGSSVGSGAGQHPMELGEEAKTKTRWVGTATPAMLLMRQRGAAHPLEEHRTREHTMLYNPGPKPSPAFLPFRLQGQLVHGMPGTALPRPWGNLSKPTRALYY
ncbi:LOW QUALITY PROTEIN: protein FAM83E [Rhinatrema bivittatum]|uniref:LOW QUALITY PROTEIN: protein FAM83E n=1 Tax=Rhinatrema bivittatum TaxID=194408 RepID=UPI00112EE2E2|nr:LOW QUALITY PROTEIN: protein FAM83E [Rhinatrema bivittatum]